MWTVHFHGLGSTTGQKGKVSWTQHSSLSPSSSSSSSSCGSAVASCHAFLPMMDCMSLRCEPKQTLSSSSCFHREFGHSSARPEPQLPRSGRKGSLVRTNIEHVYTLHTRRIVNAHLNSTSACNGSLCYTSEDTYDWSVLLKSL